MRLHVNCARAIGTSEPRPLFVA